jgi:sulfur carrier protein ThiS
MITVNNRKIRFYPSEITLMRLIELLKDDDKFNHLINETTTVIINKCVVPSSDYVNRIIRNEDIIFIYPALAGG